VEGRYHELGGLDRYGENSLAGDLAEAKVKEVLTRMDRPPVPFGPNRVSTERAQHTTWTKELRHAPDFLGWGRFIEVQGSDGETVIFKTDKLDALTWWDAMMPVFFGIYLQDKDEVLFCDMASVLWSIAHPSTVEMTLDQDTRNPKQAFKVQVSALLERRAMDAFAAYKAESSRRKKKNA
jgi:hypothetical protein